MRIFALFVAVVALGGCASRSLVPEKNNVKMSRENPPKGCEDLGKVTGATITATQKAEVALEDMQKEAAAKGATFVRIEQYSAQGTKVTGTAFKCN